MCNEPVNIFKQGRFIVKVFQDEDCDCNPRDDDNLGIMTCFHNRYNLGDNKHVFTEADYPKIKADDDYYYAPAYEDSPDGFINYLNDYSDKIVALPLFLYDHSGITMRVEPFRDPWDSGQVGVIYVTYEKLREEYKWKRITKKRIARIKSYLQCEVEVYDSYLRGEIYSFVKYKKNGEEVDSVGGFLGDNFNANGLFDYAGFNPKSKSFSQIE